MEILKCYWKCMAIAYPAQLQRRGSVLFMFSHRRNQDALKSTEGSGLSQESGGKAQARYHGSSATIPPGHLLSLVPWGGLGSSPFNKHITPHYCHFRGGDEAASLALPCAVYIVDLTVGSAMQAHAVSSPPRSGGCDPRQPGPPDEGTITSQQSD